MQITLIGTRHRERGKCNARELYQILKDLQPDVIFEEMSPKNFDDYYMSQKRSKLESIAISRYQQHQKALQIPVDIDDIPEDEYLSAFDIVFKTVYELKTQDGVDFRELTNQVNWHTIQYGFNYLNSIDHTHAWSQSLEIINNALKNINSDKLFTSLELWQSVNTEREIKMLENLYNFSQDSKFKNAVFLIGAYHKQSIIDKISVIEERRKLNVVWHFDTLPAPNMGFAASGADE